MNQPVDPYEKKTKHVRTRIIHSLKRGVGVAVTISNAVNSRLPVFPQNSRAQEHMIANRKVAILA
jgi:hypothetical protein